MNLKSLPWTQIAAFGLTLIAGTSGGYYAASPPSNSKLTQTADIQCQPTKVIVPIQVYLDGKRVRAE